MDHYQTLKVNRDATDEEIKKGYRRQAMLHHPDRHAKADAAGKKMAEEAFKNVQRAYDVLSNPAKKTSYDFDLKHGYTSSSTSSNSSSSQSTTADAMKKRYEEMYKTSGGAKSEPSWEDRLKAAQERMREAEFKKAAESWARAQAEMRKRAKQPDPYDDWSDDRTGPDDYQEESPINNRNIVSEYEITIEEAFRGKHVKVTYQISDNKRGIVEVKIPPGVRDGTRIKSAGGGEQRYSWSPAGDFYLVVKIKPDDNWTRDENDLYLNTPISALDLIIGGSIFVPTIEGDTLEVTIRSGTQVNNKIRIPNRGMVDGKGKRGDMFLQFVVEVPKLDKNNTRVMELLEELRHLI